MIVIYGALNFCMVIPILWRANWQWGLPLIVITVVFHVLVLGFANLTAVHVFDCKMNRCYPVLSFAAVMSTVVFIATALHAAEAALWPVFYQSLDVLPAFKLGMLYTLGAMATFARPDLHLENGWELMGAIEVLNGWLLFGLTTAFLFGLIQKCREIGDRDHLLPGTRRHAR